jgi:hypothetical protein
MIVTVVVKNGFYIGVFLNRERAIEYLTALHPNEEMDDFGEWVRFDQEKYNIFRDKIG